MSAQHLSAIHVLKGQLALSDDEYRDVLQQLTGLRSSAQMTLQQRAKVREHLQRQALRLGVAKPAPAAPAAASPRRGAVLSPEQFAQAKAKASPRERKVWALWHALHRAGLVHDTSAAALDAWVGRHVQVSALRFCKDTQLDTCIEALKEWLTRAPAAAQPKA
jgi:phage gp16-like protein